jgi:hypothetical protein
MAKNDPKRGLDEQLLEGGGGGGGIGGTKWSNLPSFKGNSSLLDDLKKINKDTSNLKGGAKKAVEDAQDRAAARTGVRAIGAGATVAGAKALTSDAAASDDDQTSKPEQSGPAGMGQIMSGKGMAKGGTASTRADGIAQRGKTKGKYL